MQISACLNLPYCQGTSEQQTMNLGWERYKVERQAMCPDPAPTKRGNYGRNQTDEQRSSFPLTATG